jgi:hypothetical protein
VSRAVINEEVGEKGLKSYYLLGKGRTGKGKGKGRGRGREARERRKGGEMIECVCMRVSPSMYMSVCVSMYLSVSLSVSSQSVCLSVSLSVSSQSVCLFVCLSVRLPRISTANKARSLFFAVSLNNFTVFLALFTVYPVSVEGYGIQDVMGKPGVDGKNTKTNHIVEVCRERPSTFLHHFNS